VVRFLGKFVVKWILKMRTLRVFLYYNCETLMLAKQAINDKLQGKVEKLIAQSVSEFF